MNPLLEAFTFFVLRPLNDLVMVFWRIERRFEFLYRQPFDRWLRPPSSARSRRGRTRAARTRALALAEEFVPDDEERNIRSVIDEISAFTRENYPPGGAQRFGNSKTYGVMRAEFTVLEDIPEGLRHGLSRSRGPTRPTSGSPGRARTCRPTCTTSASARWGSRSWASTGPS